MWNVSAFSRLALGVLLVTGSASVAGADIRLTESSLHASVRARVDPHYRPHSFRKGVRAGSRARAAGWSGRRAITPSCVFPGLIDSTASIIPAMSRPDDVGVRATPRNAGHTAQNAASSARREPAGIVRVSRPLTRDLAGCT